ncbi:MAG: hypothetical protein Q4F29_10045 [Lachnospiraceae bacterium]|nr:hypothetical protein [Lachnospiraceae bacterium]
MTFIGILSGSAALVVELYDEMIHLKRSEMKNRMKDRQKTEQIQEK